MTKSILAISAFSKKRDTISGFSDYIYKKLSRLPAYNWRTSTETQEHSNGLEKRKRELAKSFMASNIHTYYIRQQA